MATATARRICRSERSLRAVRLRDVNFPGRAAWVGLIEEEGVMDDGDGIGAEYEPEDLFPGVM